LFQPNNIIRQRLRKMTVGFDRIDGRFIPRSHYLAKEPHGRVLLKLTRSIKTATVVKQHRQANARF